jgi:radical SAM protein with 4Fe4S-binding SPASM domain
MRLAADYYVAGGGALGLSSMQSDVFSDKLLLRRLKHLKDGYAEPKRFFVYTTTYLVGAAKYSDEDLEAVLRRIDYLQISLGGTDRDSYRKMYGVNAFDTVRTQLLRIKRIVNEKDINIRLSLMFRTQHPELTLDSGLVKELSDTFDVAENRNTFFSWGGIIEQSDLPEGAQLSVVDNTKMRTDCAVASASMSIGVDGTVVGCGCVDWNAKHVVGNAVTDKWTEVWKSEKAVAFREAFSRGNVPDLCKDCSLYVPIDEAFSRDSMRDYRPSRGLWYLQ